MTQICTLLFYSDSEQVVTNFIFVIAVELPWPIVLQGLVTYIWFWWALKGTVQELVCQVIFGSRFHHVLYVRSFPSSSTVVHLDPNPNSSILTRVLELQLLTSHCHLAPLGGKGFSLGGSCSPAFVLERGHESRPHSLTRNICSNGSLCSG